MEIARQLYQLQELDTEIEHQEQALRLKNGLLGNREALAAAQEKLSFEQKRLDDLKHQRHEAEWQVDDNRSKIAAADSQLYGGKVTNPKELSNLQHEINTLKGKNDETETRALEIIDQLEAAEKSIANLSTEYQKIEDEWQHAQKQLTTEIEHLKISLADIKQQRQQLIGQIDSNTIAQYERIRRLKKVAVAKVEQGICGICHISQSASALQRARGGQCVQCGSCGRILFIS